jgi:AcrR family transcriptional regulator
VTTPARTARATRADTTRAALLAAAERLFAERGISTVSHRQITEAAEQANNAAVVYHFGTKVDLVRAIEHKHAGDIEALRAAKIADSATEAGLRRWAACLVEPLTTHLAALGNPTWYARFTSQVMTDPSYQRIVTGMALQSATLREILEGFNRELPNLPNYVRAERNIMTRTMLIHTCAEVERGFAAGAPVARPDWAASGHALIDVIVALWQSPITPQ